MLLCTPHAVAFSECLPLAQAANISIAWMSNRSAAEYASNSLPWATLSLATFKVVGKGDRTVEEFHEHGVEISCYNADTDAQMEYFIQRKGLMKAICTNYPKKLIEKLK